jgi:DNA mismatch repair ATPase MutS
MFYILFFLLLLTIAVMLATRSFKIKQKKILDELFAQWGSPKKEGFNFNNIAIYSKVVKENGYHQLSEQTKNDIDFDDLFCLVDRTTSKVGQQFLFNAMNRPTNDLSKLLELNLQADFFVQHESVRKEIQALLQKLNHNDAYFIAGLLREDLPGKPGWFKWIKLYFFAELFLIFTCLFYPFFMLYLLMPFSINVFLHYRNKNNIIRFSKSFQQLNRLIDVCKKLTSKDLPFRKEEAITGADSLKSIQRRSRLIGFEDGGVADDVKQIGLYLVELTKAFLLVEFFTFYRLINEIKNKQAAILNLFQYAGEIDMSVSLASLRSDNLKTCIPVLLPPVKQFSAAGLYHPLIADCVTNDISIVSKSVLITGSNMSGKTTFLRALALNSILAQTIFTCFADTFNTPVLKLHSSVRIDDNLLDGKSFYFEEVNVMAALVNQVKEQAQNLFILDEVFKGTNTIERIASAKAILSFLNKNNNIVFVSTHDVELAALLADEYELHHFSETIDEGGLQFDHKLKAGPLTTRNAIRILEMFNYPIEITDEARNLSEKLSA